MSDVPLITMTQEMHVANNLLHKIPPTSIENYLFQFVSWIDDNLQEKPFLEADSFRLVLSFVNPPVKTKTIIVRV